MEDREQEKQQERETGRIGIGKQMRQDSRREATRKDVHGE